MPVQPTCRSALLIDEVLRREDAEEGLNFPWRALDGKSFAESVDISTQALGGIINNLKNNPASRDELKKLGYTEEQIPNRVIKRALVETVPAVETAPAVQRA